MPATWNEQTNVNILSFKKNRSNRIVQIKTKASYPSLPRHAWSGTLHSSSSCLMLWLQGSVSWTVNRIAVSSSYTDVHSSVPLLFSPSTELRPCELKLPSFLELPWSVSPREHSFLGVFIPSLFSVCWHSESPHGLSFSRYCQIALQSGRMDSHSH